MKTFLGTLFYHNHVQSTVKIWRPLALDALLIFSEDTTFTFIQECQACDLFHAGEDSINEIDAEGFCGIYPPLHYISKR